MATINEVEARVLSELKRPSLTTEATRAVADAILFFSPQRFWFNEDVVTFETIAGDSDRSLASGNTATFSRIIMAEVLDGDTQREMHPLDWEEYRDVTANAATQQGGVPVWYSFFGDSFYMNPTPDAEYTVTLSCIRDLGVPASGASNAWTTVAEPLIRARTKWDLLFNVIRQYDEARFQGGDTGTGGLVASWIGQLQKRTGGHGRSGFVRSSGW